MSVSGNCWGRTDSYASDISILVYTAQNWSRTKFIEQFLSCWIRFSLSFSPKNRNMTSIRSRDTRETIVWRCTGAQAGTWCMFSERVRLAFIKKVPMQFVNEHLKKSFQNCSYKRFLWIVWLSWVFRVLVEEKWTLYGADISVLVHTTQNWFRTEFIEQFLSCSIRIFLFFFHQISIWDAIRSTDKWETVFPMMH